jgi:flagellar biogenesis protein FliO
MFGIMLDTIATTPEAVATIKSPLLTMGYILQLIISLAIVVGLIYFSMRYVLPKIQLPANGKLIEIVDRIGLEPQVSAYIIATQGRSYLIVVSAKNVTLIDKLETYAGGDLPS